MCTLQPLFLLLTLLTISTTNAYNITEILSPFPEYKQYNTYLTQTKLSDEINTHETITVLVFSNSAMSTLASKHPLSVIKNYLALHVLLDYFDPKELHQISNGTTLSTTLYQTTGKSAGKLGFVNITDHTGGEVSFTSAVPGSHISSSYTKPIKEIPYNISVIEISSPIDAPEILAAPAPTSDLNITALLEKAGCKTFASYIVSTGVIKVFFTAVNNGLTVFAPSDEAFKAVGLPDLSKLTNAEMVSLLQYHALAGYNPIGSLKSAKDPISTLASNGAEKYDVTMTTAGDEVTIHTGVDSSRIATTVLDSTPLCIFTVDSLLLPTELFGKAPSPAPVMGPVLAPSPVPVASSPGPVASAPSPFLSPPAPPMEAPVGGPAEGPDGESQNTTADNGAGDGKGLGFLKVLVTVAVTVIISGLVS